MTRMHSRLYPYRIYLRVHFNLIIFLKFMLEYMKSITTFQVYMLNYDATGYIGRYCRQLNVYDWERFYHQMKEPYDFIMDEKYLFYILKWILKEPYDDLSYEVYADCSVSGTHIRTIIQR